MFRWSILLYTFLFGLAVFVKRQQVRRMINKDPFLFKNQPAVTGYIVKRLHPFYAFWLGGLNIQAFFPNFGRAYFPPLVSWDLNIPGAGFLFGSWVLFVVSLVHMKEAWRVGIDMEKANRLITGGVYSFIRHPIYTSVKMALLGSVALFPNAYFLSITVMGFLATTLIALQEEEFLRNKFGAAFEVYEKKTGRFLPKIIYRDPEGPKGS